MARAERVLEQLGALMRGGYKLGKGDVKTAAQLVVQDEGVELADYFLRGAPRTSGRRQVLPKSVNQRRYLDAIEAHDIVFGIGALRDHVAVDRQRNELALFREAFERSNDAIFITDAATGRFIDFNAAASRWLQYTPEELRQLGPPDVVVQLGFLQRWADVADAVKASGSVIWPRTFRRKDGSDIPAEVGLTAITSGGRDLDRASDRRDSPIELPRFGVSRREDVEGKRVGAVRQRDGALGEGHGAGAVPHTRIA